MTRRATLLAAAVTLLIPAWAAAGPVADLRGEWIAEEAPGISLGDPRAGVSVNDSAKPTLMMNRIVMTVSDQDGPRFAGITRHTYGQDRFVAMMRADGRSFRGADAEGSLDGTLLSDTEIELCYTEHSPMRALASCWTLRRAAAR